MLDRDPAQEETLYRAATDLLVELHRHAPPAGLATYGPAPMADLAALSVDWYRFGITGRAEAGLRARLCELLQTHLAALPGLDSVLIQRDYHAENLLWLPERTGVARVGLLDFQDAMRGHRAYDLVSLLQDARRDVSPATADAMLAHYIAATGAEAEAFSAAFHWLGAQRNLRILGVFARLCLRDGKPHYIDLIPRVWAHLQTDLRHPGLAPLAALLAEALPPPDAGALATAPGGLRAMTLPVMIFAAGFGTRMGALTRDRPKPLIEVAGRALIDHALGLVDGLCAAAHRGQPALPRGSARRASRGARRASLAGDPGDPRHRGRAARGAAAARRGPGPHDEFRRDLARAQPARPSRAALGRGADGGAAAVSAAPARAGPCRGRGFRARARRPPRPRAGARLFRGADHRPGLPWRAIPEPVFSLNRAWDALAAAGPSLRRGLSRALVRCRAARGDRAGRGDAGGAMFETDPVPRLFGLAPGVDFPRALLDGLRARLEGAPPEAMARVQIIVNTRRMARRLRDLFDAGPPGLLPRVSLVTDLGESWDLGRVPPPAPRLRRRLELVQLVTALIDRQPDLAPRSAIFGLADSLAALMDEMHGEGIAPETLAALDITDQSGHWARIRAFLGIIRPCFDDAAERPDSETRQRMVVERLIAAWQDTPPAHPVIVAGSTGSRGATHLLMQAVARLPQGAVVLPGFDFDTPAQVWDTLDDPMISEDHPQFRFARLAGGAGIAPAAIRPWHDAPPPCPARNRLVSLALRPAPVTDQWLRDGPALDALDAATRDVTLLEAPDTRREALAIALRLRHGRRGGDRRGAHHARPHARAAGHRGARPLAHQPRRQRRSAAAPVAAGAAPAACRRSLHRPARHRDAAHAAQAPAHPSGRRARRASAPDARARAASAALRSALPGRGGAAPMGRGERRPGAAGLDRLALRVLCRARPPRRAPARGTHVAEHLALAERIARGSDATEGAGTLWDMAAGEEARAAMDELVAEAGAGGAMSAMDYAQLFHSLLATREVRDPLEPHPRIRIWGTLEARVQGADLLILAGLNEGSWPEAPAPDPWLNRALRVQAGLLLPERNIGLAAHDFQQAVAAREVWLTRSVRSADAPTVVARWLNRVQNLLGGLPDQGGEAALEAMRARGRDWLRRAAQLEDPGQTARAPRPAPCPPVALRPRQLSVTEMRTLIRDPYAIYARHVLRLRPLDPLMKVPDALLRGTVLHAILDRFINETLADPARLSTHALLEVTEAVLADTVPWAEARALWLARIERVADWFVAGEIARRAEAQPAALERRGGWCSPIRPSRSRPRPTASISTRTGAR